MKERKGSNVGLIAATTASLATLAASGGTYFTAEALAFSPDPAKTERIIDLQSASEELDLVSFNPQFALGTIDTSLQLLGDEQNFDDRLRIISKTIETNDNKPLTPEQKGEILLISQEILNASGVLSRENSNQDDETAGGVMFIIAVTIVIAGTTMAVFENDYHQKKW